MKKWSAPMRLGWSKNFPLLVCGLVGLCIVSVAGHGGNIKNGDVCVPWDCSCFYRGVYYDKGDQWDSEDDPCTRYKCVDNGFFHPIKSGCSFKGTCHDRNSTWTEGCFRYKCLPGYGTAVYQLDEAACVWKDGNCYAVGQQAIEHCNIYECQIDGGCYVMNKVRSACKTDDVNAPCKPLFSFWQDECAVYQCTGENQQRLGARILRHSHDVMMWPRGHYALPEPKQGCANLGEQFWLEGTHWQSGDGCNYESQKFDLLGDYNDTIYEHNFCVHHDIDDPDIIPLYQTYWEKGRYCILRYNGSCPENFNEGFVEMFNSFSNVTNITTGVLPDGNFTENITRMEFCCRYDGEIHRPIILPAKHPFVLFMAENETECQAVQGMNHDIEFWSFCDTDDGVNRTLNGSLPLIKTGDNNTMINFCFYHPVGCGCTDEDETVVAIGDTVTRECVTKECKHVDRFNVMVVIEGGCYDEVNEVCRAEDVVWSDREGEMCIERQCVRVKNETENVVFEIQEVSKGCWDGDKCRPVNYTKSKGCYSTQCQEDPYTGKTEFVVTKAGCSRGNGLCIPDGETFKQGCVTLRCDKSKSKCGLSIVKGGCSYKGKCYDVGEQFTHYCSEFVCEKYKKTYKTISWRFKAVKRRCRDSRGNCYDVGTKVNTTCATYQCVTGSKTVFSKIWGGCRVQDGNKTICVAPNKEIKRGCTYKCALYENGATKLVQQSPVGCPVGDKCYKPGDIIDDPARCCTYRCTSEGKKQVINVGCSFKNKCFPANKEFKDGCSTYFCKVNSTHVHVQRKTIACSVGDKCYNPGDIIDDRERCCTYRCTAQGKKQVINYECSFKGKCYPANKEFKLNCSTYYCFVNTTYIKVEHKSIACKVEGRCIPPGQTFKYKCHTYKCSEDEKSCKSEFLEYGCKDEAGKCVEKGGLVTKNCQKYTCAPNGKQSPYKFHSGGCPQDGKCMNVGDVIKQDNCQAIKCGYHNNQLARVLLKGCVDNGVCYEHGAAKKGKTTYYCKTWKCHSGSMYLAELSCKTADGGCVELEKGESKTYNIVYNNKKGTATCTKTSTGSVKITNIRCPAR